MQCSCHTSNTFVQRRKPSIASQAQLHCSLRGSPVSHARFAGTPLQCRPVQTSGRPQRCVTSMASKGSSRHHRAESNLPGKPGPSLGNVIAGSTTLEFVHCSDGPDQTRTASWQSQSSSPCWSCAWCQGDTLHQCDGI